MCKQQRIDELTTIDVLNTMRPAFVRLTDIFNILDSEGYPPDSLPMLDNLVGWAKIHRVYMWAIEDLQRD